MPRQTSLRARGAAATADRVKPKDRPNPGRKKIDLLKTRIDAELDAELRGGAEEDERKHSEHGENSGSPPECGWPSRPAMEMDPLVPGAVGDLDELIDLALSCAGVGFFCFFNTLICDLIFDDVPAILHNPDVTMQTPARWDFLYNDYWGTPMSSPESHKSYRPLTVLSFRANYILHGPYPPAFHLSNILAHAACTTLLVLLCGTVIFRGPNRDISALSAGALFGTHPIHADAVASVVGRAELLSAAMFLLSLLAYCHYAVDPRIPFGSGLIWRILPSVGLAACAMLFKEQGITALGGCAVLDVVYFSGSTRSAQTRSAARIACVTICCLLICYARLLMNQGDPNISPGMNPAAHCNDTMTRAMTWNYIAAINAGLLLWPSTLCSDWSHGSIPLVKDVADERNLWTALAYGVYCVLVLWGLYHWRGGRYSNSALSLLAGLVLMVMTFIPSSNLFFPVGFVVAERVLYLPSMGYIIALVTLLDAFTKHVAKGRPFLARILDPLPSNMDNHDKGYRAALALLVLPYMCRSLVRNHDWRSFSALMESAATTFPNNSAALNNYALVMLRAPTFGDPGQAAYNNQQALALATAAVDNWDTSAVFLTTLGMAWKQSGDHASAKAVFRQALQIDPSHSPALYGLGNTFYGENNYTFGLRLYEKGTRMVVNSHRGMAVYTDFHIKAADCRHMLGLHAESEKRLKSLTKQLRLRGENGGSRPFEQDENYGHLMVILARSMAWQQHPNLKDAYKALKAASTSPRSNFGGFATLYCQVIELMMIYDFSHKKLESLLRARVGLYFEEEARLTMSLVILKFLRGHDDEARQQLVAYAAKWPQLATQQVMGSFVRPWAVKNKTVSEILEREAENWPATHAEWLRTQEYHAEWLKMQEAIEPLV